MSDTHRQIRLAKPWFPSGTTEAVQEVLDSGWVASGKIAEEFGERMAEVEGYDYGVCTNSCTSALQVALEIYPFDQNIINISHITFPATANAVIAAGFLPRITDFGFNLGVDLFGLKEREREEWVIADAACSFGSKSKVSNPDLKPDIACYSFHARKLISTGEGGALCTDNEILYERAKALINHGNVRDFGYNMRMSDINAAIGLVQLDHLDSILAQRHLLAKWYSRYLPKDGENLQIYGQEHRTIVNKDYNYQTFCIILPFDKDEIDYESFLAILRQNGVECNFGTYNLAKMSYYSDFVDPWADLDDPAYVALPIHQEMTEEDVEYVCDKVQYACEAVFPNGD